MVLYNTEREIDMSPELASSSWDCCITVRWGSMKASDPQAALLRSRNTNSLHFHWQWPLRLVRKSKNWKSKGRFRQRTDGGLLVATSPMRKIWKLKYSGHTNLAVGDTALIRNTEPLINQMPFPIEKKRWKMPSKKRWKIWSVDGSA